MYMGISKKWSQDRKLTVSMKSGEKPLLSRFFQMDFFPWLIYNSVFFIIIKVLLIYTLPKVPHEKTMWLLLYPYYQVPTHTPMQALSSSVVRCHRFAICLLHWSMGLFLCQYQIVLITVTLQQSLKLGSIIPPALFFLLQIALAIQGLLWFRMYFRTIFSSSLKTLLLV